MLVLKKWLQVWYLATTSDEPDEVDDVNTDVTVTVHVQGDKPEQIAKSLGHHYFHNQSYPPPPPQGCFGQEGTFVQLYIADTSWVDLLRANNAHLVGLVVSPVCGKDCCIVDVVLPGQGPSRRCHLGQRYVREPQSFSWILSI
ncbi:hypothetical protein AC1031_019860 [Aphanomyces cochlioides]|nr:hypothetical protein AC1031_019860 [Aphanomyces cochlioides]